MDHDCQASMFKKTKKQNIRVKAVKVFKIFQIQESLIYFRVMVFLQFQEIRIDIVIDNF